MSQVLSTFRSALGTALGAPMHLTVVLVVGTAAALATVVIPFVPLVGLLAGPLLNTVLLAPLVLAALLGSADAARNGASAWNGAQSAIDDAWVDVVGAYGVLTLVWIAVGGAAAVTTLLGAVGMGSIADLGSVPTGTAALLSLPLVALAGVTVVAGMVVQFVAPAAVVTGADAVESIRTAVRFALANPLGVVGFSLVALLVGVVASLPGAALAGVVWYTGHEIAAAVILVIGYLEAATVAGAITSVYLVEYFETAADASVLPADAARRGEPDTGGFEFGTARNESERL